MTVEVTRDPLVESVHEVAWAVADIAGQILEFEGSVNVPVLLRSASKPFQAMAVLAGGAADAYHFTEPEIAIVGGSHHGEPAHIEAVMGILTKSGVPVSALQCGAHSPYNTAAQAALAAEGSTPAVLHSNCSGKHAGLLALAKYLGAPLEGYLERSHPTEDAVFRALSAFCDVPEEDIPYGVDGCGLPAAALTLRQAAIGFARFAAPPRDLGTWADVANRLRDAQAAFPVMVAGTESFNTHLLQAAPHLCAKAGAEGVFCVGNTETGQGLALKVRDGSNRAVPPATVELLARLGWLDEAALERLERFHRPIVRNVAGRTVGHIQAKAS